MHAIMLLSLVLDRALALVLAHNSSLIFGIQMRVTKHCKPIHIGDIDDYGQQLFMISLTCVVHRFEQPNTRSSSEAPLFLLHGHRADIRYYTRRYYTGSRISSTLMVYDTAEASIAAVHFWSSKRVNDIVDFAN
eukprot:scaffold50222_cov39-Prasinocladus_malaysianus.AAC.3